MTKFQIALLAIAAVALAALGFNAVNEKNKRANQIDAISLIDMDILRGYAPQTRAERAKVKIEADAARRAEYKANIEAHAAFAREMKTNEWVEFTAPERHQINQIEHCVRQIAQDVVQKDYGPILADASTVKTITLINGRTLAMAETTQATQRGQYVSTRVWLNDSCIIVAGSPQFDTLDVTPIPATTDAPPSLRFQKTNPASKSRFVASINRNELVMWRAPYVENASLEVRQDETDCLYKVIAQGPSAALKTTIRDVCPNSADRLKAETEVYYFARFSFDEIALVNADRKSWGDPTFIERRDEQYLLTLKLGVDAYPESTLSADDYTWFPTWKQHAAWATNPAN